MTSGPVTVALVDDHAIIREAIEYHLQIGLPNVKVIASVTCLTELADEVAPDVVISDLILRDGPCLGVLPSLLRRGSKVLLYTGHERPVPLRQAVAMGVSGILLKADPVSTLVEAVNMALRGQFYVSGPLAQALITDPNLVADLSDQQRQVLQCINEGLDYRATGRIMNISGNTVKEYLARIREKYRELGQDPGNAHHLTKLARDEGQLY